MRSSLVLAVLGVALAAAPIAGGTTGARAPRTYTVTIDSTSFQPAELTVRAGDTVVWVNKDMFPHTATSAAGKFDSQVIATGNQWRYQVKARGEFPYTCTFHPTMKGTLRVR